MTGRLTFIGNATTLVEYGSFTLLTDPNFLHRGQKAYLGKGVLLIDDLCEVPRRHPDIDVGLWHPVERGESLELPPAG
jgi:L-ascorbate metabolism protein UlaG (beta-lactamase superfamily)